MAEENYINKVGHIEEVDSKEWFSDRSNEVNDYLSLGGWILLNTGTRASTVGDGGAAVSRVYYVVGWIWPGDPKIPPARPLN